MNQAAIRALTELLPKIFVTPPTDLIAWLPSIPDGDRIVSNLPGRDVPPSELFFKTTDILRRYGLLGIPEFWNELETQAPYAHKATVRELRGQFGVAAATTPAPTQPIATSALTPTVTTPSSSSPIVVLLVSASPDSHERLRVDKEFNKIIAKIRGTRFRDLFRFVQLQAARFEDLQTALQEHEPHILHISSHGNESGALRFEASDTGTSLVSKKRILRLLKALGDNFRAIIVNACHSSALVRDIPAEIGVPAIGMYTAVKDTTSIAFSTSFYESLGFGKSIEKAFDVAYANIEDAESEEVDPDDDDEDDAADPASEAAEQIDIPELYPPADNDPKNLRKLVLVK